MHPTTVSYQQELRRIHRQGITFDQDFKIIFARSVYEHGVHIVNNLEWSSTLRANHYLADIIGLLFVAAYLPCTDKTNTWLALAIHELINEVAKKADLTKKFELRRIHADWIRLRSTGGRLGLPTNFRCQFFPCANAKGRPNFQYSQPIRE